MVLSANQIKKIIYIIYFLSTNILVSCNSKAETKKELLDSNKTIQLNTPKINISQDSLIKLFQKIPKIKKESYFGNAYISNIPSYQLVMQTDKIKIILANKDTQVVTFNKNKIIYTKATNGGYESTYISFLQVQQQIFILVKSSFEDGGHCVHSTHTIFRFDSDKQTLIDITKKLIDNMAALYGLDKTEKTQSLFYVGAYTEGLELRPNIRCLELRAPQNIKTPDPSVRKLIPIEEILTW